jgi:hypothetical protein
MNTTPFRPSLSCRVVRFSRALASGAGSQHVARCAACQAYYQAAERLEGALRREAFASRPAISSAPDALERSILRAVRESTVAPAPRRSWQGAWAVGAAAAVAVVAAVWMQRPAAPADSFADIPPPSPAEAAAFLNAVENLSARLTQRVIPSAGAMVANNPMRQELGSVYADARSALDFLALNFLPTPPQRAAAATVSAERG